MYCSLLEFLTSVTRSCYLLPFFADCAFPEQQCVSDLSVKVVSGWLSVKILPF